MTTPLDPATLRALAAELNVAAEELRRCCGGAHVGHRERIAVYTWLSNDFRSKALRAELNAKEATA